MSGCRKVPVSINSQYKKVTGKFQYGSKVHRFMKITLHLWLLHPLKHSIHLFFFAVIYQPKPIPSATPNWWGPKCEISGEFKILEYQK